jgi:hypothetical protein
MIVQVGRFRPMEQQDWHYRRSHEQGYKDGVITLEEAKTMEHL